jgi:hypothetical protein
MIVRSNNLFVYCKATDSHKHHGEVSAVQYMPGVRVLASLRQCLSLRL